MLKSGFYLLSIRGSYNPYVLVGEVTVDGFLLTVSNPILVRRFGNEQTLRNLANRGPAHDTQLLRPEKDDEDGVEYIYWPNVSRAIPADPEKWKE